MRIAGIQGVRRGVHHTATTTRNERARRHGPGALRMKRRRVGGPANFRHRDARRKGPDALSLLRPGDSWIHSVLEGVRIV
jgi:hypothetical protein